MRRNLLRNLSYIDTQMRRLARRGVIPNSFAVGHSPKVRRQIARLKFGLKYHHDLTWAQRAKQLGLRTQSRVRRDYRFWQNIENCRKYLMSVSDLENGVAPHAKDPRVGGLNQALLHHYDGISYTDFVHDVGLATQQEYNEFLRGERQRNRIKEYVEKHGGMPTGNWVNKLRTLVRRRWGETLEEWYEKPLPKRPSDFKFHPPRIVEEKKSEIRRIIQSVVKNKRDARILLRRAVKMHKLKEIAEDEGISREQLGRILHKHAPSLHPHLVEIGLDAKKLLGITQRKKK